MNRILIIFHPVVITAICFIIGVCIFFEGLFLVSIKKIKKDKNTVTSKSLFNVNEMFEFSKEEINKGVYPPESQEMVYDNSSQYHWINKYISRYIEADFNNKILPIKKIEKIKIIKPNRLTVIPDRQFYYRFHIVKLVAYPCSDLLDKTLYAVLYKNGKPVKNASGSYFSPFLIRNEHLTVSLNPGFNPKLGRYIVKIFIAGEDEPACLNVPIVIRSRKLKKVKKGFAVMTMETAIPLKYQKVLSPFNGWGSYMNLFKWAKLMDVDALWMLGSQTSGQEKTLTPCKPHGKTTLRNVNLISKAAKDNKIGFGSYIISYYTPHGGIRKAGYLPSIGYNLKEDRLYVSRHTSLRSKKRFYDILQFAKKMQKNNNVDYIGFDFIRTGHSDGYEMVDKVVDDMNIPVPHEWVNYNKTDRMRWLARKILIDKNRSVILKWRWWRAHWVASIINSIKTKGKLTKPMWVFTLGWEHGRQHGQDPYMMLDAGCFINAAMLYEASEKQFSGMEKQWAKYINAKTTSVIIGNCVDTKLNPSRVRHPLAEFYRRNLRGFTKFSHNGFAKGIFWHDVARAIWGRTGENYGLEWAYVGGSSITAIREKLGFFPFRLDVPEYTLIKHSKVQKFIFKVKNISKKVLKNLKIKLLPSPVFADNKNIQQRFIKKIKKGESKIIEFSTKFNNRKYLDIVHTFAVKVELKGLRAYIKHGFLNFKNNKIEDLTINKNP